MNIIRLSAGRVVEPSGGAASWQESLRRVVAGPWRNSWVQQWRVSLPLSSVPSPPIQGANVSPTPFKFLCQADPELTLTSLDGVSVFDIVSRRAMLEGLASVHGGSSTLFFVHLFCGWPSTCLWEDDHGVVHEVHQGEGGEQGDPFMPLFFAGPVHAIVAEELGRHAHISINEGETHVLQQFAEIANPTARVVEEQRGIRVLRAPVGHPSFVRAQLHAIQVDHQTLLDRAYSLSPRRSIQLAPAPLRCRPRQSFPLRGASFSSRRFCA